MSLQFIIDGYNVIRHPLLTSTNKKTGDQRIALLEFIRANKLTGSANNRVIVVFDGYPDSNLTGGDFNGINVIFSRKESADERIKGILQRCAGVKGMVVVSNDKELKFFAKSSGVTVLTVEEFIETKKKTKTNCQPLKPELSFTQMHKINTELKKLWLGE